MPTVAPPFLLALPASLVALLAFVVVLVAGGPWWLALVVAMVVGTVVAVVVWRRAPAVALRALGAEPLRPDDEPRLANIVDGLCATHGVAVPKLHAVRSDVPNAAILGHGAGDSHLVVTTGLLRSLDRLELEAVVARELGQLRRGVESATVLVTVAGLLGRAGLGGPLLRRVLDQRGVAEADADGVRLTRYPPALASAFEKVSAAGPMPAGAASRHLWLVSVGTDTDPDASQPPLVERIDFLREI